MATIERALNAHSLYWIKDETGDRIGIVWGLDGQWRWSVGSGELRAAHSYDDARTAIEAVLGARLKDKTRKSKAA